MPAMSVAISFALGRNSTSQEKIRSAIYGKMYGDFKIVGKKNVIKGVSFLYYLNPTPNDRNLEWDMTNNLCPKPGFIGNPLP